MSAQQDKGCEVAASCLNCPLLKCIYDVYGGKDHYLKQQRDKEIVRLFTTEGKKAKELARTFGVCERTIHGVLSKEKIK